MGFTLGDAVVFFKGDDSQLTKDVDTAENKTKGFVSNATSLLGGALVGGAVAAGAAIVGIGTAGVNAFIDFEGKMNEVFTLLPGISKTGMDEMNQQVKDFAREFGVLPDEVVPALYQAISAGVPPDNVFEFLAVANKAAVGGVAELETAVDGITSVVNAYGAETIDAAKASDLMFTAVKLGKTDFGQLSASLFNVIPTAASTGVAFEDITAALAAMTAQGTPTSVATTQMRQLLVELSQDGGKASDVFKEMAGKSFVDFVAGGGNVQDALILMEEAAVSNGKRLSDMFGSVEAGNAALALTGKGAETFSKNLEEMQNAAGATDAAFETMNGGIGKSLERMKAAWAVALIDVGDSLAPLIEAVLPALTTALTVAIGWVTDFFGVLGTLSQYFIVVVQDGDTLNDFLTHLPEPLRGVVSAFGEIVTFLRGNFFGTMDETGGRFDFIRQRVDEIMPYIQTLITNVLGFIQQFWSQHGETIMAIVGNMMDNMLIVITTITDVLLQTIKLFLQILTGDWEGAGQTLQEIVRTLWDGISQLFNNAIENIKLIFTGFDWGQLGRNILEGIANGITNAVGLIADAARRAAQSAYDAARSFLGISSPSKKAEEEIGQPFGEGFGIGAAKSIRNMATSLNLSLAGLFGDLQMQGAGGGAGMPISIMVNVYGDDSQNVGNGARNGVLDALRQAGLR